MTLRDAIAADDVDELYRLIEGDEKLLDHGSEGPFPNTPLHDAADKGKTKVAMEIAILKPSFTRKLNRGGHSPMHLALQKKHYDIVRALMTLDPELIRVRGRGGITPLHFVAREKGDDEQELLELLAEFLCACKSSIEDLTCRRETAVHVAIKNHNLKAFKVLFGWLKRVHLTEILVWKDEDGNSVFQTARIEKQQLEQQPPLEQKYEQIRVQSEINELLNGNTKVEAKKEALEFLQNLAEFLSFGGRCVPKDDVKLSLSNLLSMELTVFEKFSFWFGVQDESARNIILTVSTLIATASYQAALSPPGGYWRDNSSNHPANSTVVSANSNGITVEKPHEAGNVILNGSNLYQFTSLNSLVFLASIITIWITAISLLPRTLTVFLLMGILGMSYFATATIGFPKSDRLGAYLTEGIYMSLQVVAFLVPLILWMSYYSFQVRIEATGRRVSDFLEWKDRKWLTSIMYH